MAKEFARAEVLREVGEIDFGSPSAHPHLVRGFGPDESASGLSFVASWRFENQFWLSDQVIIEFFLAWPRAVELELDCRRFSPSEPLAELAVQLNDHPVGNIHLARGRRSHTLQLSADQLVAGVNTLRFKPTPPGELLWFSLRFRAEGIPATGRLDQPLLVGNSEEGVLELPFGTRLDYYLTPPLDGVLKLASLENAPGAEGVLDVTVALMDGRSRLIETVDPGRPEKAGELRIPIFDDSSGKSGDARRPIRLSLTARPRSGARPTGHLLLARPRIVSDAVNPVVDASDGESRDRGGVKPNVVIYVMDTLRRDHLGVYGYPRPVSPRLDAFARDAVVFDGAVAQSSWTRPALVSLFTGLNPLRHGVTDTFRVLSDQAVTLAEFFRSAGYDTAAFTDNVHMSSQFGVDQGFRRYWNHESRPWTVTDVHRDHADWPERHPEQDLLHEAALDWLHRRGEAQPFLLFVHAMGPHEPYRPPETFWQALAPEVSRSDRVAYTDLNDLQRGSISQLTVDKLRALYDAEIAANDERFGILLDALKSAGLYRDCLIIFTSDHGEAFFERGSLGHGSDLYAETRRIPLLWKSPGSERGGRHVRGVVPQVDLLPTLLEWVGLPKAAESDGTSFAKVLRGGDLLPDAFGPAFAHLHRANSALRTSVTEGRWTLIHTAGTAGYDESLELYDATSDPLDLIDLAETQPEVVARLTAMLESGNAQAPSWPVFESDQAPAFLAQLEALGYAQ